MTNHAFGEIITLDFPYSHHRSGKKRPAMIVAQDAEGDIVVANTKKLSIPPQKPLDFFYIFRAAHNKRGALVQTLRLDFKDALVSGARFAAGLLHNE